uniref:Uncharacterized protein n=1 Tax=Arundo donax TaxID=35708 RepID=A0A0A9C5H5_ARUDO
MMAALKWMDGWRILDLMMVALKWMDDFFM